MEHSLYFPLFVDLSGQKILVVGAGSIASRRAHSLLPFTKNITVVAPNVHPALETLADEGKVTLLRRTYEPEDVDTADLVLVATDDHQLNCQIAARCKALRIPVNVCDDPNACDFFFPGIARKGDLVIGVTAGGTDHKAVKAVTEELRRYIQEQIE